MFTEGFEQWMKLGKNAAMPLHEWNKTITDFGAQIAQQNAEMVSDNLARLSDQFKRLSMVKKPEELFNLQRECMNENISASINGMHHLLQTALINMEEMTKVFMATGDAIRTNQQTAMQRAGSMQQGGSQSRRTEKDKTDR